MFSSRRIWTLTLVGSSSLLLSGCTSPSSADMPANSSKVDQRGVDQSESAKPSEPPVDPTEATIDGNVITRSELMKPLVDAFGLNMLLELVKLDLARQQASRMGVSVTSNDIAAETQMYLDQMFKDDKFLGEMRDQVEQKTHDGKLAEAEQTRRAISKEQERLLNQLLDNKKLTRTEFDLAMQTNAYLRAIVRPAVEAKLTDDNLQESFRARYGEKVQVRHIALGNLQEVTEAKRRLADGVPFAQVAQDMSRNRQSAALGGELPPFSKMSPGYPQVFKDNAFALQKVGDISDPVMADNAYHLIQLMGRIDPKAVKFEDVRESVKADLSETLTQASIRDLRAQLGQLALKDLQISDPVLREQFHSKITQQKDEVQGREAIREAIKSERQPATAPAPAATPELTTPAMTTPAMTTPAMTAPNVTTPAMTTPNVTTPAPAAAATEPARSATAPPAATSLTTRP